MSGRSKALLDEASILAAARWRLADWTPEEVQQGLAVAARLHRLGVALSDGTPDVRQAQAILARRGDRRDAWSALMALLTLHADAAGDVRMFLLAGFEVVTAWRNSRAGSSNGALSELSEMIRAYQANRPAATAEELFDFWCSIAGAHPVLEDYDQERDVLIYLRNGRPVEVKRESFGRQFRRIQHGYKKNEGGSRAQPVGVRRAA